MFNLFKWSANQQNDENMTHPPHPPPPPPLPQQSLLKAVNSDCARNTAQSLDVLSTLQRIENKLDILLTKIDLSESKRKKFAPNNNAPVEDVTHSSKLPISKETDGFVAELMKKVEERKLAKHMGASHGFASVAEVIQFTMDQAHTSS